MNSKPCIHGMRIAVSIALNLLANGISKAEILDDYPYLEPADIEQCLNYAAYLAGGRLVCIRIYRILELTELRSVRDFFDQLNMKQFNNSDHSG